MISYVSILGTPYVSYSNITEKYENIQLGKEKTRVLNKNIHMVFIIVGYVWSFVEKRKLSSLVNLQSITMAICLGILLDFKIEVWILNPEIDVYGILSIVLQSNMISKWMIPILGTNGDEDSNTWLDEKWLVLTQLDG